MTRGFLHHGHVERKAFPCNDVIMGVRLVDTRHLRTESSMVTFAEYRQKEYVCGLPASSPLKSLPASPCVQFTLILSYQTVAS